MIQKLLNVFRIAELRTKLLFTVALLCVYRIGFFIPLPGIDAPGLRHTIEDSLKGGGTGSTSPFDLLSSYLSVFSGGDLTQGSIFGLGIMPYISASIIIQLLGTVVPSLEKMKKEGEPGIRKINEWTRYLTVIVCVIQAAFYVTHFHTEKGRQGLYSAILNSDYYYFMFQLLVITGLTAGSVFMMWLGEQIDHYGIGNGVSLIITAGIIARMPQAINQIFKNTSLTIGAKAGTVGPEVLLFIIACFIFVVAGSILLTQAQRRIPIQQAKHMRGRRVYGGSKQYLPLKVNHAGVMPIIFASSLMMLPAVGFAKLAEMANSGKPDKGWFELSMDFLARRMNYGGYYYEVLFCLLIIGFSFFWNTVQFQPKEMANQLRDYGSFIPGLRPGKRTADYLENVMTRITYVGAGFLCIIAIIPSMVANSMLAGVPNSFQISQFLGGTSLLIVISVMLDLVNRIEANLVMRNYGGFMDGNTGGGPGKLKRAKGSPARPVAQPQAAITPAKGLPA